MLDFPRHRFCEGANGEVTRFVPASGPGFLAVGYFEHLGFVPSAQPEAGSREAFRVKAVRVLPDGGITSPEDIAGRGELEADQSQRGVFVSSEKLEAAQATLTPLFASSSAVEQAMASLRALLQRVEPHRGEIRAFRQTDGSVLVWLREDREYSNADRYFGTPMRLDGHGREVVGYLENLSSLTGPAAALAEREPLLQRPDGVVIFRGLLQEHDPYADYLLVYPVSPEGKIHTSFLMNLLDAWHRAPCVNDPQPSSAERLLAAPEGRAALLVVWGRDITPGWRCLLRVLPDGTPDWEFGNPFGKYGIKSVEPELAEHSGLFDEQLHEMEFGATLQVEAVHVTPAQDIYVGGQFALDDGNRCVMNLAVFTHDGRLR